MKKKKTVKIIIIVAAVVVVIAGALILVRVLNKNKKADVVPVSMINDSWLSMDQGSYSGVVSTGRIQNVKLKQALVDNVLVHVGDQVNIGDTLLVYDSTEYQLALLNDEANIAVLESQINKAQKEAARYGSLKPSEEAPEPWDEIIDHGPLPIKDTLKEEDVKEEYNYYLITLNTVIEKGFLKKLREKKYYADLTLYEGDANFGNYLITGEDIPLLVDDYVEIEEESTTEKASEEGPSKEPASEKHYKKVKVDPIKEDWKLGNIIEFLDFAGGYKVGADYKYYGEVVFYDPIYYERYEVITHYPEYDDSDNYIYSRAELADMIKAKTREAEELKRDLLIAQINLQKDQLTASTGEVKATVSGTVTDVADMSRASVGESVITIKGSENYSVTVYVDELSLSSFKVGDMGSVTAYESGNYAEATVTEIEQMPLSSGMGYGSGNPNSSYYPVTMVVNDPELNMSIGEYCQVQMTSSGEVSESIFIPLMYVRNDEKGHYCMVAENNRLKKRYVQTGANFYGSEIEIKNGLSVDDYIAFPYGAGENVGAPVEIKENIYD